MASAYPLEPTAKVTSQRRAASWWRERRRNADALTEPSSWVESLRWELPTEVVPCCLNQVFMQVVYHSGRGLSTKIDESTIIYHGANSVKYFFDPCFGPSAPTIRIS